MLQLAEQFKREIGPEKLREILRKQVTMIMAP
jgi:hypothetical protein